MRLQILSPVALLLAAGGSLMAQEVMGTITGTIRTPDGAPLVGATVRVNSAKTLSDRTAITDAQGNFRLPLLLPGDYKGTVSKDGFVGSKAEFRIGAGGVVRQDFVMRPVQTTGAIVEVVASSSAVDKTQTKTASTQTMEEIATIPTTGNYAIKALAALTMSPSVNESNPYYATVRGGAQGQTQYMVNGLSVRDNITSQGRPHDVILDDLVEESQIILSPLNAKYGDSSAGLINIVEKTGSNEFSGTIRAKLDRGSWNVQRPRGWTINRTPYNTPEAAPSDDLTRTYELSISGPIIKNVLTFTYGTRVQPSSTAVRTAVNLNTNTFALQQGAAVAAFQYNNNQSRLLPTKFSFHQGRLFWQIGQNHSLDYSHAENTNLYADWGAGANTNSIDFALGSEQTSVTKFRQITYRGIFFGNQTFELRYGAKESTIKFVSGPGDPIEVPWVVAGANQIHTGAVRAITNGGNADNRPELRNTYNLIANYTGYFELAGTHNVDAGFSWIKTQWGSVQNSGGPNQRTFRTAGRLPGDNFVMFNYNTPVNGVNYFSDNSGAYRGSIPSMTQYLGASNGDLTKPTTSLYVNDQWSFNNNFSLMMGLRYEKYVYNDSQGERYNSSSTSPRFEAKWDIGGNNQRIVNLSYGEFRGNVHERITRAFSTFR
ncbi:MAG: TonB-dependent receptor, partial [Holophaga sp.]|nr:TonB-dependent receptor [Holophaga sp.]